MHTTNGGGLGDDDIGSLYKSIQFQQGYGFGYMDPFPYESYGLGFGESISSLFRMAIPYLKEGQTYLGKKAVNTVANIANDAIEGKSVPESAKRHVYEAADDVFAKAPAHLAQIANKRGRSQIKSVNHSDASASATTPQRRGTTGVRKRLRLGSNARTGLLKTYPALNNIL